MNKSVALPATLSELTPAWLTHALRSTETIRNTAVKSYQVEHLVVGAGLVGKVVRVRLEYAQPETGAPRSLIAKFPTADPNKRGWFTSLYEREICIYKEFEDDIGLPVPRFYYGESNPDTGAYVLLIEDLGAFDKYDLAHGCAYEQAAAVMSHLAQFHAKWWNSDRVQDLPFLKPFNTWAENDQKNFTQRWPQFPDKVHALLPEFHFPDAYLDLGHQLAPKLVDIYDRLSSKPFTFLHHDVHLDNLFFGVTDSDPSVMFVDWQVAGYGRGVNDVSYFILFSLPVTVRRQRERLLLQIYHDGLMQNGVLGYSFEQCWEDYQRAFFRSMNASVKYMFVLDYSHSYGRKTLDTVLTQLIAFSEDHRVARFLD